MNILYLHAHDAGRIVQPYGYPVPTPNLQRFAEESVLFRKAFCVAPTCGPSRAALTTGQYPHQAGMFGLPNAYQWAFDDYSKHVVRQFKDLGYLTVLAGVHHECEKSDTPILGYERLLDSEAPAREVPGHWYPETIEKTEAFLATYRQTYGDRPFFLSVGIDEPHRDNLPRPELNLHGRSDRFSKTRYYDPAKLDSRYTAPPPGLPDLPGLRQDMASYQRGARIMDDYMGRVFEALEHTGLDQDTLVIVTSDHGIEFPGAKKTLGDQGIQVMLMLRGPKGGDTPFCGGRVMEPMVTHLDLYPTLVELCGLRPPQTLEGKSLLPLVRGEVATLHEMIFCEQTYHGPEEAIRCARSERYKFVRRLHPTAHRMRHDGPATPLVEPLGWYDRPTGTEELYDLYLDPFEAHNRIHDPALAGVRAEHAAALEDWMARTGDPFPGGKFPAPGSLVDVKKIQAEAHAQTR